MNEYVNNDQSLAVNNKCCLKADWNFYLIFCVILMCQRCQALQCFSEPVLLLRKNLSIWYYNLATIGRQQKQLKNMFFFFSPLEFRYIKYKWLVPFFFLPILPRTAPFLDFLDLFVHDPKVLLLLVCLLHPILR